MKTRLLFVTFIILLLILSSNQVSSNLINNNVDKNLTNTVFPSCYIIENVPYIGQETGYDCELCSFAMLVSYLGKNYGLYDLFYLTGSGHTLSYTPSKKFLPTSIWPGSLSSIGETDWFLISNMLGVKCNLTYFEKNLCDEQSWNEYWNRVKNYITNDKPVYTQVDMSVLSYNRKYKEFEVGSGAPHALVIIGYNENNNTVCLNDPAPAFEGRIDEGRYFFENLSYFREAVEKSTDCKYEIYKNGYLTIVLENISDAIDKKQAYNMTRFRNLAKMSGDIWAFDDIFLKDDEKYGINAVRSFQNDVKPLKIFLRLPIWGILRFGDKIIKPNDKFPFWIMPYFIKIVGMEKQFVSEALFDINDCEICKKEAGFFQNESEKWYQIYNCYNNVVELIEKNRFLKAQIITIPMFIEIQRLLDEIIEIEKNILDETSIVLN